MSDVCAKIVFLSRINRSPFGSSQNSNIKAELFSQVRQLGLSDERIIKQYETGYLYDRSLLLPLSDNVFDEIMSDAKTIFEKAEGVPWLL